jgi:mRNA-degrading endonuclease RelE of RelBE toxin-antitoxin system
LAWTIEFTPRAQRDFKKLDRPIQQRIRDFLKQRVSTLVDPNNSGNGSAVRYRNSGDTGLVTIASFAASKMTG